MSGKLQISDNKLLLNWEAEHSTLQSDQVISASLCKYFFSSISLRLISFFQCPPWAHICQPLYLCHALSHVCSSVEYNHKTVLLFEMCSTNKGPLPWSALSVLVCLHPCGHLPAEVVVAQAETAGVRFSSREPPPSQWGGVPVDALGSRVAEAPCASVALTLSHHTLLIGVCWGDGLSFREAGYRVTPFNTQINITGINPLNNLSWHNKHVIQPY